MPIVDKIKKVQAALKKLESKYRTPDGKAPSVQVGFCQSYALIVHEDLEAKHKEGKQAKYLEAPARELASELGAIVSDVTKKTGDLGQGLLVAGLRLQRASQEIVPVDTSALKASAFTALETEADTIAQQAWERSEQVKRTKDKT